MNFKEEYILNFETYKNLNYYEILLKVIDNNNGSTNNKNMMNTLLKDININEIYDIGYLLNFKKFNPKQIVHHYIFIKKKYKNKISSKKKFYKEYPEFNYVFYSKVKQKEFTEIEAIYDYIHKGCYENIPTIK